MRRTLHGLAIVVLLLLSHPVYADLTALGDLPGGSFSSNALAISGDGSVVAGTSEGGSGTEAFRWRQLHPRQPGQSE